MARDSLEKADIRKKAAEKKKQLDRLQNGLQKKITNIKAEAEKDVENFNEQFNINPSLLVNIVLRF